MYDFDRVVPTDILRLAALLSDGALGTLSRFNREAMQDLARACRAAMCPLFESYAQFLQELQGQHAPYRGVFVIAAGSNPGGESDLHYAYRIFRGVFDTLSSAPSCPCLAMRTASRVLTEFVRQLQGIQTPALA